MAYRLSKVRKRYGELLVLDGVDLEPRMGGVSAVLGPSGCGKTSLLNIIAGLDGDYEGELEGFGPVRPSYAFQEDRLLPWKSALANVALPLEAIYGRAEARDRAMEALKSVGLERDAKSRPGALSGGMRKRVALARAFAFPSELMLLDEPFSSLDLKTRLSVMDLFLELRERSGRTALVVTHDVREAIYLGDLIYCLTDKPSKVAMRAEPGLGRAGRSFTSPASAEVEAALYEALLS